MEKYRRILLFAVVALSFITFLLDYFYGNETEREIKKRINYWYDQGRKYWYNQGRKALGL